MTTTNKTVPWGRLVGLSKNVPQTLVNLENDQLVIGRGSRADPQCRFQDIRISKKHCVIFKIENEGKFSIYVEDFSSNGTFINGKRMEKENKVLINHGDIISLCTSKEIPDSQDYIAYMFQNLLPKELIAQKLEETNQSSATLDKKSQTELEKKRKKLINSSDSNENTSPIKKPKLEKDEQEEDVYEAKLQCGICQDILYKALTLVPCMHNFCQSCYSQWKKKNEICPECRETVITFRRNHAIIQLVEAYLKTHPEKQRSLEEIKELDQNCDITDEMLRNPISNLSKKKTKEKPSFLSHPAPGYIEDEYEEENDEYEEEYNEEDYDEEYLPSLVKCRQCSVPSEDGFLCSRGGPHFTCSVCFLPFPDRSSEGIGNFQCEFCGSVVCGGYWRCPNSGKLQLLGEYSLTSLPSHALNYNPVEVSILQEYLTSKGKDIKTLYSECMEQLDLGQIVYSYCGKRVYSGSYACGKCANKIFGDIVYNYRENIKREDLKYEVISRPDCYYGRNCRSQAHNYEHCKNYNHIAEQTKFD